MLTTAEIRTIETLLWAAAGVFAFSAAWFQFRESGQTADQKSATRQAYRDKWLRLRQTRLLALPDLAINGLLDTTALTLPTIARTAGEWWMRSGWSFFFVVAFWSCSIGAGLAVAVSPPIGAGVAAGLIVLFYLTPFLPAGKPMAALFAISGVAAAVLWPRAMMELHIVLAAGLLLLTLPFFAGMLSFAFGAVVEDWVEESPSVTWWMLLGASVAASMVITAGALAAGSLATPDLPVPKTLLEVPSKSV